MSKITEKELLEEFEYFTKNIPKHITSDTHSPLNKHGRACVRIVELIKIFFAKEISSGPIKEDISRPILAEWLEGINQAATAMKDHYVMKATMQLIGMIKEEKKARLIWDATCPEIAPTWLPTAENINALPKPLYDYIAGLETNADPPSMVADNIIMKDTIKTLEKICEERPAVDEGFVNTWAKEFGPATLYNRELHKKVKDMLKEAGVEVIKI